MGNKPPPPTPGKPKKATTFQEFESITSDAWDVGDDDDELLAMAAQNLNIEVVMETANKVNGNMQWPSLRQLSLIQVFLGQLSILSTTSKLFMESRLFVSDIFIIVFTFQTFFLFLYYYIVCGHLWLDHS